jgi:hypothetical protein
LDIFTSISNFRKWSLSGGSTAFVARPVDLGLLPQFCAAATDAIKISN